MRIFLLLICLPLLRFGFAQDLETTYGKEFLNNKKNAFNGFIGENELTLFGVDYTAASKRKQELIINSFYKNDLTLVESKDIYSNPLPEFDHIPTEIFYEDEQFYLFSKFIDAKNNTSFVGLSIYNESAVPTFFEIIDTIENFSNTTIEIKQSENKKNFVVIQNYTHKVANRQVLKLKTFDLNGSPKWSKELLSSNNVHKIMVEQIIFSDNEIYVLCNYGYNINNRNSTPTVLSNKYTLWIYNPEINFMKEVELRLKLKWINGISIALNFNKELIIAGHINTSREFGINGMFNVVLNQKYEVNTLNYYPFKDSDLRKFKPDKTSDGVNYLPDFYLRDLVMMPDGSFYILSERYHKFIDRNYDPRTNITTTTEHFVYGNILVAFFDNTAKLKWIENVPKSQNSINDFGLYSSFTYQKTDEQLFLFYNDNEKNIEMPLNDYFNQKELFNYRRNMHTCVAITPEGVKNRLKLNQDKTNFLLYPKHSKPINHNTLYLFADYGRHSKIIGVSLK